MLLSPTGTADGIRVATLALDPGPETDGAATVLADQESARADAWGKPCRH
jgi:hypothetical protein